MYFFGCILFMRSNHRPTVLELNFLTRWKNKIHQILGLFEEKVLEIAKGQFRVRMTARL